MPVVKKPAVRKRAPAKTAKPKKPAIPKWYVPFLTALAQGHTAIWSCERAGVSPQNAYKARKSDAGFSDAWDQALEAGIQVAEEALFTRAVTGWQKPVFYQGDEVATVTEYSDTLLQFLLRAKRPSTYRENSTIDISGSVAHEISVLGGKQPIEVDAALRREAAQKLLGTSKVKV